MIMYMWPYMIEEFTNIFGFNCIARCTPFIFSLISSILEGPVPVLRDASKIQVGFWILREILAGSGILFHRGKWDY